MSMTLRRMAMTAVFAAVFLGTVAMAVEEPVFKVVLHEGDFDVRDYPALVVAEVTVSGDQKQAANRGFRLLAGYIFGGNRTRQSIAMTAPVAQAPASQTIAMTAPVTQTQSAGQWVVRFTMPSRYSLEALPEPNDPQVKLRLIPPSRLAVLRFSGLAGADTVEAKTADLKKRLSAHQLQATGPATLAQYNPPWTPWFMRRNEVMIPVAP
ncbi:heme-binding protein [Caulobacter vibrioides]|uniref:SOUL family heme-binding protein n=1 Tax=Caulobacter vibrioides TaxID=155892 RepID=UPI000BB5107E|nr:heme-binding protein [Caulobacter vibrioides]ATC25538.1 heme-binding protein [Caulobacter vibrioides]AZH13629.1 heme-binding protein [Caulobacter vibrioides]PLR14499.1 heme-binding protein [Caulobacter vibrioides]